MQKTEMKIFKKKVLKIVLILALVVLIVPSNVYAASYNNIKRQFSGYGVSMTTTSGVRIGSPIVVTKVTNKTNHTITSKDSFSVKKGITFSSGCSSAISSSISSSSGAVNGKLGAKMNASYNFSGHLVTTYKKSINVKVPKKSTYTLTATIMGDKVSIYWKKFNAWITTSKGNGTVYVPRYVVWTTQN